jgi:phage/plasmid-associated DNA primase
MAEPIKPKIQEVKGVFAHFEKNDFSYSKTEAETKRAMQKYSSTIMRFVVDCCEKTSAVDQYENHDDLYEAYAQYCQLIQHNFTLESEHKFKEALREEYPLRRARTPTGNEYRWYHIKYHPERNQ